jgi:hypothetical protein
MVIYEPEELPQWSGLRELGHDSIVGYSKSLPVNEMRILVEICADCVIETFHEILGS